MHIREGYCFLLLDLLCSLDSNIQGESPGVCTGLSFGASDKRIKYNEKFFRAFIDAGYEIGVWTVNDIWLAHNLAKMGARYIVSDRPVTMQFAWKKLFE